MLEDRAHDFSLPEEDLPEAPIEPAPPPGWEAAPAVARKTGVRAPVRAKWLSPGWIDENLTGLRYGSVYDHKWTFLSYLGRTPDYLPNGVWEKELAELCDAIPADHRDFLANLPWVAEAEGHAFLHNGLSPELDCPAGVQLECLHRKCWEYAVVQPRFGTVTCSRAGFTAFILANPSALNRSERPPRTARTGISRKAAKNGQRFTGAKSTANGLAMSRS